MLHLHSCLLSTNTDLGVSAHLQKRKLRPTELRYLDTISHLVNSRGRITAVQGSKH